MNDDGEVTIKCFDYQYKCHHDNYPSPVGPPAAPGKPLEKVLEQLALLAADGEVTILNLQRHGSQIISLKGGEAPRIALASGCPASTDSAVAWRAGLAGDEVSSNCHQCMVISVWVVVVSQARRGQQQLSSM